jgi:hypothetical protein
MQPLHNCIWALFLAESPSVVPVLLRYAVSPEDHPSESYSLALTGSCLRCPVCAAHVTAWPIVVLTSCWLFSVNTIYDNVHGYTAIATAVATANCSKLGQFQQLLFFSLSSVLQQSSACTASILWCISLAAPVLKYK